MSAPRIALATCAEVPDLDDDELPLVAALSARGVEGVPAVWDDAAVDWLRFALVVLRSTWDYAERRAEFLRWVDSLPDVLNRPEVVRWNTDKRYLAELQGQGVPVVPTAFLEPGEAFEPSDRRFVVKPAVSAGGRRSASYDPHDVRAAEHVRALHGAGDTAMVQPYADEVDEAGETALLYIGGAYSHTVGKDALLAAPPPAGDVLFLPERISPREPSDGERETAERALAALPFSAADLLYARVDLLPSSDGPLVLEVELTEPSLFLRHGAGAVDRFADAIARAVRGR